MTNDDEIRAVVRGAVSTAPEPPTVQAILERSSGANSHLPSAFAKLAVLALIVVGGLLLWNPGSNTTSDVELAAPSTVAQSAPPASVTTESTQPEETSTSTQAPSTTATTSALADQPQADLDWIQGSNLRDAVSAQPAGEPWILAWYEGGVLVLDIDGVVRGHLLDLEHQQVSEDRLWLPSNANCWPDQRKQVESLTHLRMFCTSIDGETSPTIEILGEDGSREVIARLPEIPSDLREQGARYIGRFFGIHPMPGNPDISLALLSVECESPATALIIDGVAQTIDGNDWWGPEGYDSSWALGWYEGEAIYELVSDCGEDRPDAGIYARDLDGGSRLLFTRPEGAEFLTIQDTLSFLVE